MPELTQARLKELIHYDPCIGIFTWVGKSAPRANRKEIGSHAGHISHNGYVIIGVDKALYMAHRLAWLYVHNVMPKAEIDHINHIRDDNRIINLRMVSRLENGRNTGKKKNNKSGINGVCWDKERETWAVYTI